MIVILHQGSFKLSGRSNDDMSEKRRDNRNRILRSGDSQRPDGRYMYKYIDSYGQVKYVYSWRLDKNDHTPSGRKRELSLREKEKQIEADLFDQIVPPGWRNDCIRSGSEVCFLKDRDPAQYGSKLQFCDSYFGKGGFREEED